MLDTVSFQGMADIPVTFQHTGLVRGQDEGKIVKLTAVKTVGLCADDDIRWLGKVVAIDKDGVHCSVELTGILSVTYSGSLGASQVMQLVADASGGLKLDETNGLYYQVVDVNTDDGVLWIVR